MSAQVPARVTRVAGAIVQVRPAANLALYELVRVGRMRLAGEVIRVQGDVATVQVYEDTTGLALGEPVEGTGSPLTVTLGPGLLGGIFDGLGRPLDQLSGADGAFIVPGGDPSTLDLARRLRVEALVAVGDAVGPGDVLARVEERDGLFHAVALPAGRSGTVAEIRSGEQALGEPFGTLDDGTSLELVQRWPVRVPRPVASRLPPRRPFLTGQRVLDLLFPVAEGGSVAVPGGFGTGKTIIEQSLAKFADADVVVYVGCGERGNEMAELISEFPRLVDPRTGRPVLDRSVLIVNTSNMPVAAREASVYLGMTVAEHYRDMGHRVALMADSLSRWTEALREISSRLEEMPGEEGYPTSLGNQMAKLYERAGHARALGRPEREGTVTFIGAISPPGGDLSEPVTQAALRAVGAVWALDPALAHQRQFPAVDWETSYTLEGDSVLGWFDEHAGPEWSRVRGAIVALLQRAEELREVAQLVGPEALADEDRVLLEAARLAREAVLAQSAFDPNDARSSVAKTLRLALLSERVYTAGRAALAAGRSLEELDFAGLRRSIVALRGVADDELEARAHEAESAIDRSLASEAAP